MSPVLEAPRSSDHLPAPPIARQAAVRSVRLLDRLALRLGLALILWSRRARARVDRDELARRHAAAAARERRAEEHVRWRGQHPPRW